MGDFIYVPIIALFCYIFLFMTLAAARKDRIINSFLLNLVALILWTGGSFLMRLQVWPSVKFWFDVSILGLLLLGFALFNFAFQFVGSKNKLIQIFWFVVTVVINVVNITTGVFLQSPELVTAPNEETAFLYHTTWPVVFFFIFCTAIIAHMFLLLFRYFKDHEVARRQFAPVMVGIGFMFLGHIAFVIPVFKGIPTDIIAGVPFALCMFYALSPPAAAATRCRLACRSSSSSTCWGPWPPLSRNICRCWAITIPSSSLCLLRFSPVSSISA